MCQSGGGIFQRNREWDREQDRKGVAEAQSSTLLCRQPHQINPQPRLKPVQLEANSARPQGLIPD